MDSKHIDLITAATKTMQMYFQEINADGSHDWYHVERVRNMSLKLAKEEGIEDPYALLVIELAAILHDFEDWKYSKEKTLKAGAKATKQFLENLNAEAQLVKDVTFIVEHMGYKNELPVHATPAIESTLTFDSMIDSKECKECSQNIEKWRYIVQDADYLDAMGCIGIARACMYGGMKRKALWQPEHELSQPDAYHRTLDQETYLKNQAPDIVGHFYEKLLRLHKFIRTDAGKRRVLKRHSIMIQFIELLRQEWSDHPFLLSE